MMLVKRILLHRVEESDLSLLILCETVNVMLSLGIVELHLVDDFLRLLLFRWEVVR